MKKSKINKVPPIAALLLAAVLLLGALCGCGVSVRPTDNENKPLVVCTIFPQYDIVKSVADDTLSVDLLIPFGTETHTFGVKDLSAARLEKLHGASLVVAVGGESDEQLLSELKTALPADVSFFLLTGVMKDLLDEERTENMEREEDEENGEKAVDEHIWTSPRRAAELARGIGKELCRLFPENAALYEKNARNYAEKLEELDQKYIDTLKNRTFNTLVFADRFPFRYLCHDYGIDADAAFAGCSSSIEPSLSTLDRLYEKAAALGLPAILYMEGSDPKYAENLAARVGGRALMLHSCHIVSEEDAKKGYVGLLEYDLGILKIALGVKS